MMKQKHYTIPIFIPMQACPFQCIYCDQVSISGTVAAPKTGDVISIIEKHLETIPVKDTIVELGFFGGTFTGLTFLQQKEYLAVAMPFILSGRLSGIRLSTRPDYIDQTTLDLLKKYRVKTIELGAQSMDDQVLKMSRRGHTPDDVIQSSKLILENGFRLGLQMMIGLPGDNIEKTLFTARKFIELGAGDVRIYPTLVIRGTLLEKWFLSGKFTPLTLEAAVSQTAEVLKVFDASGVNVIRVGLHPSAGLQSGSNLVAGPYHVSFSELVHTKIWGDLLAGIDQKATSGVMTIFVPERQINHAIGYGGANRKDLEKIFGRVSFKSDPTLKKWEYYVDICR